MKLANGDFADGIGLSPDGDVHILCSDGSYRQVHPAVVDAFAQQMVPTGIWLVAHMRRTNKDNLLKTYGAKMAIDPTKP